jgi:hypothetical protein
MRSYVVRVWLPDRPGALGAVASRIGAVRGDLVGIDILERGAGRVIDELVVELPDCTDGNDAAMLDLLLSEMHQVDGVDVENVRPSVDALADPRVDALETAALLVGENSIDGLLDTVALHAGHALDAEWTVVLDLASSAPRVAVGDPPPAAWVGAFVAGSRSVARVAAGECGPDDVAWAAMAGADLALVLGRRGRPFRARERRQLDALCRITEHRYTELALRASKGLHPSVVAAM